MMRIWKWTLDVTDMQKLKMPADARLLAVQMEHGSPQLWAICNPEKLVVERKIAIYGTGNPIPDEPGKYIATFQQNNGFVWHVFAPDKTGLETE